MMILIAILLFLLLCVFAWPLVLWLACGLLGAVVAGALALFLMASANPDAAMLDFGIACLAAIGGFVGGIGCAVEWLRAMGV
jgi:hypothetical protein